MATQVFGPARHLAVVVVTIVLAVMGPVSHASLDADHLKTQIQIFGAWHCGNDFCTWSAARDMADFDAKNRWLIDRGDGRPSINLVVLSFVEPLKLLNRTTDGTTLNGVPRGMNTDVVNYFKNAGVRVMLSIGGITYADEWNAALDANPAQLALNAAAVAQSLGVGIEIDYEENMNPRLAALQTFIETYRSQLPYDATGVNHAARLTIDIAAGARWLIALQTKAKHEWLLTADRGAPVLDYANAMVPSRQPSTAADAQKNWQEHIDGKPQYDPPEPPLAAAKFTGSLYIVTGTRPAAECVKFPGSLTDTTGNYVQSVHTKVGTTNGMLGYMFWAAECPSARRLCTTPPNTCEAGVGAGATAYTIPIPMPPLRQQ